MSLCFIRLVLQEDERRMQLLVEDIIMQERKNIQNLGSISKKAIMEHLLNIITEKKASS